MIKITDRFYINASSTCYTLQGIDKSGYHVPISQYGEDVKSIVTKELMKNIEYRID